MQADTLIVFLFSERRSEGTQLTDVLELAPADAEVDEAAAEKAMKEYEDAGK